MAITLRQSTASQEIVLGPFLDSTDGNTEETALTIANTDIKIWKMGATTLANKNSGGATHISNGIYSAVLDATDTDTLGGLVIFIHVAGALAVRLECEVLNAANYDAFIAGTGTYPANVTQLAGSAIDQTAGLINANVKQISTDATAADNLEAMLDGTGGVTLTATLSDLATIIADSVPTDGTRPTMRQALLMICRFLMERSVAGTTVTVKKEDGTTANMTFTLDSATTPTSITRAT